jgi:hypothetical protein
MKSAPMSCAFVLSSVIALAGCGPSPAMPPSTPAHARRVAPAGQVVEVVDSDDDVVDDDDEAALETARPVEYVRLEEWQPPPSVKEIEARIEPRGDKPPEYVDLPRLRLHREIVPITTYRRGYYWP